MHHLRHPRRYDKQPIALALILVVWTSWVIAPGYSSSRPTPEAVATTIKSSKTTSQPGPDFAVGSKTYGTAITAMQQQCTTPPSGMVNWWPGDGNANDIQDGNNGTLKNGASFAPGLVGQAFSFDGVDDSVESSPTTVMNALPLTVEAWVKPELRNDAISDPNDFLGSAGGFPNNVISNDKPFQAGHGFGVNVIPTRSFMIVEFQHGFKLVPGGGIISGWTVVSRSSCLYTR